MKDRPTAAMPIKMATPRKIRIGRYSRSRLSEDMIGLSVLSGWGRRADRTRKGPDARTGAPREAKVRYRHNKSDIRRTSRKGKRAMPNRDRRTNAGRAGRRLRSSGRNGGSGGARTRDLRRDRPAL